MPTSPFPKLPLPVQLAIGIPSFILSGWWSYTYTGPYRWLAEWQIREWGTFYQFYTFFAVLVVPVLLAALLVHLVCWWTGFDFDQQQTEESAERWRDWYDQRRFRIGCMFVGLVVAVLSGSSYYVGKTAGPQTRMSVAELENGVKPASGWLVLRGNLLRERLARWTTERSSKSDIYVPLVSDDRLAGGQVAVIVHCNDGGGKEEARLFLDGGESVDGLVEPHGLPGHVRTTLEDNGVTLVAAPIVIDYRANPELQTRLGAIGLVIGAILILLGAVIWLIKQDSLLP